ncbi:MAG: polysaccharide deacetylase family protein [bacterium]|nr:polysaccharide deacetylase family protein [bacterium]
MARKRKLKKGFKKFLVLVLLLAVIGGGYYIYQLYIGNLDMQHKEKKQEEERIMLEQINNNYATYVKTTTSTKLYENNEGVFNEVGNVQESVVLNLSEIDNLTLDNKYFQIKDTTYYVSYDSVGPTEAKKYDDTYKNYLPFNENIVTGDKTNMYQDDKLILTINKSIDEPIIIKNDDTYSIEYMNQLFSIKKEDVKEIRENTNTDEESAQSIAVLNYHFFYSADLGEVCNEAICLETKKFEEQLKYFVDNDIYTLKMKDMEMFLDENIRLPKKSVLLTIDDGAMGVANKAIPLLEKYDLQATLFLITGWWELNNFISDNLEVHSHTNDMHHNNKCSSNGQGSMVLCVDKEKGLADLKKSREILNNTTYFCFPFYEYNDYSISLIKEAGFTMAFIGGQRKASIGVDKYKVPRFTVYDSTSLQQIIKWIS